MDIATGAMNTVIIKLGELLVGEYNLQKGVKGEIEELQKELISMNAALCKVSEMPADQLDELAKIWARDVRELSYDIEDVVDIFMLQGTGHEPAKTFGFKGFIDRTINLLKKAMANYQIHSIIKDIMIQVKMVNERRKRYKVGDVAAGLSTVTVDPRLEGIYKKATELVGIDGPKNELTKRLMEEDSSSGQQQPKIISIVGFGGLGKTTLANALLQHLRAKFDCHLFVSVSLNPDIKMILKNILVQLDEKRYDIIPEAWDVKQLIDKIREQLEHRRCLCVIDDVWKESDWDTTKLALQDGYCGSRIIITTRNKALAEHAGGGVQELKPLSDDDSKKLLYKRIFDTEHGCPPSLTEVSGKILKKCGGVPLAIITIASLLSSNPIHSVEWEKVNNSIGSGLEKSPDVDKMKKILCLSYNDLPFHLKTCLLSLSKYPEDTVIRKDVLVWSWIAEGFIAEKTQPAGKSLQEIGDEYFSELINRSLIQPMDIHGIYKQDCDVHACQVHDMVLELINEMSVEEGFVTTLLSDGEQADTRTSAAQNRKIRRLSLHNSNKSYALRGRSREQLSEVRSITVFGKVDSVPPLSSLNVLRVLQLEDCTCLDNDHFNDLGELRHLRFLRLHRYSATKLPESIGKLESLETLDVRGCCLEILLLPMSFVKLRKLVRLFADRVMLPEGLALGDMKSLQELVGIYLTPEVTKEIGNLKGLRVLRILVDKGVVDGTCDVSEFIRMCLQRCTNLQDLDIGSNSLGISSSSLDSTPVPSGLRRFMTGEIRMRAFPRWISSTLSCLTTLSINMSTDLRPHHLEKLAELPSLCFLRLHVYGTWGWQKLSIPSGAFAFRCLRDFHFYSPWTMSLTFQPGAMPELQRLCLQSYYHLEKENINDVGLENLHSLRHVIIQCMDLRLNADVQEAETAVREALKHNPNHPSFEVIKSPFAID